MKICILKEDLRSANIIIGGTIITKRNIDIINDVFGSENVRTIYYKLPDTSTIWGRLLRRLFFFTGGMSPILLLGIIKDVVKVKPDVLFLDSSLYGYLARRLNKYGISIITFFHNVEVDYYSDLVRGRNFILKYLVLKLIKLIEMWSVIYSDVIITLNERDSNRLNNIYGRSSDLILPTSFKDVSMLKVMPKLDEITRLLFVGYNFYPNLHGINWFVDNVMNKLGNDFMLYIVGRNMEKERSLLSRENVEVIGTVNDLAEWYNKCDIVVLPIFFGSGMKTKTAEAMMFSKPILATKESFEGYELDDYSSVGAICQTAEEYVSQIRYLAKNNSLIAQKGNRARTLFLSKFDYRCVLHKASGFFTHKYNL